MEFGKDDLLKLYANLVRSRKWDEEMIDAHRRNKMVTFYHSGIGQEAVGVGACTFLRDDDWIVATHRGRAHSIAKGVPMAPMFAEWYGRKTGLSKGKGGEHWAYLELGVGGMSGTIGGSFPIALGLSMACRMNGKGQVVVCFFGDGAAQRGTLHESMNWAAAMDLPVVWICENNKYAITMCTREAMGTEDIADLAHGYGMPGEIVDGQDLLAVARATLAAVDRARQGHGPTLIECKTWRYREHGESDPKTSYRNVEEHMRWMERDPVKLFRSHLLSEGIGEKELDGIDREAEKEVEEAEAWAYSTETSPWPEPEEAFEDLYVEQRGG